MLLCEGDYYNAIMIICFSMLLLKIWLYSDQVTKFLLM